MSGGAHDGFGSSGHVRVTTGDERLMDSVGERLAAEVRR
jgi:hypothetical protein